MLSETRETADMIQGSQQPTLSAKVAPIHNKPQHTPYVSNGPNKAAVTTTTSNNQDEDQVEKSKFQRSDAYNRIRRSSVGNVGPIKKPVTKEEKGPSTFKRMFSSMYSKPTNKKPQDDSDEEEEEESEEESEEEEEESEEEESEKSESEEEDDESEASSKPKSKSTFTGLLKVVSFKKR